MFILLQLIVFIDTEKSSRMLYSKTISNLLFFLVVELIFLHLRRLISRVACKADLLRFAQKFALCVFKKVVIGTYDAWIDASVSEVQKAMRTGKTLSQIDDVYDVSAKEFDRKYLPIKYGASGK